jgi:hypothetical protein
MYAPLSPFAGVTLTIVVRGTVDCYTQQVAKGWHFSRLVKQTKLNGIMLTVAGVYFDIKVNGTTKILLSLHNAPKPVKKVAETPTLDAEALPTSHLAHLSFHPSSFNQKPSKPISLLARIDDEEYILLPNSSTLVSVSVGLSNRITHDVRIIAPMTDSSLGNGVLELEGIYLDPGAKLLRVEGSYLEEDVESEDDFEAGNAGIGSKHMIGLKAIGGHSQKPYAEEDALDVIQPERKKVLEIITDYPGAFGGGRKKGMRTGGAAGLLGGVLGWEYLLGEMFGVDHVSIGVDGMCLMQKCIGGTGDPASMADVFFRSGPDADSYFSHPWMFQSYIPDVMVRTPQL